MSWGRSTHHRVRQELLSISMMFGLVNELLSSLFPSVVRTASLGRSTHDPIQALRLFMIRMPLFGSSQSKKKTLFPSRMEANSGKSIH